MKLFNDILKPNGKYSQGRVYLLWTIIAYYVTLGFMTYVGLTKMEFDIRSLDLVIQSLEYAMTLFGSYVFGGKFIDAYQSIKKAKTQE